MYREAWNKGVLLPGLLIALAASACASDPQREARVLAAISGEWESQASAPDRSGWRRALSVLDNATAAPPDHLILRADGSFEAHYGAKQHRLLQRILGGDELPNPIIGSFRIGLDWNGASWIRFAPGAPERRLTLQHGQLTLHAVDPEWTNERYRRHAPTSTDSGRGLR